MISRPGTAASLPPLPLLLILFLLLAARATAHGHEGDEAMDMPSTNTTTDDDVDVDDIYSFPSYFGLATLSGWMVAHIVLEVVAWLFVLPIGKPSSR